MGMSTNVRGFVPPDDKWKKMKKVYDSCKEAGIDFDEMPSDVQNFFDDGDPDEKGMQVEIPYEDYRVDSEEGIEIEVEKIPKNVKFIRFVNSW